MPQKKEVTGKKQLAIVGTAGTMSAAPYDDEKFEIWAISTAAAHEGMKRADRLFEMHPRRYFGQAAVLERLMEFDGPVYMQEHFPEIPNSVAYPYEEVREAYYIPAMGDNLYVTNTITWMILLALHEGYKDLNFFGVHMAHDTEYYYQQPSCAWALGMAQASGCSIWLPNESEILKARFEYGFGEPTDAMKRLNKRMDALAKGVKEGQSQMTGIHQRILRTEGALEEAKYWHGYFSGTR
jgi:hypothetical protein